MRVLLLFCSLFLSVSLCSAQGDTTRLYFDLDVDSLSSASRQKLNVFLRNNHIGRDQSVIIIGYTDYLGTEDYNIVLSKERARNVAYYLLERDVNEENITVCMGRGRIERKGHSDARGYPTDRRVDIVVVDKPKPVVPREKSLKAPKDPMDMDVVFKPGERRDPIPPDMKNIPLYRESADKPPKKPGTSYNLNDSGNLYVVVRPGGEKPNLPPQLRPDPNDGKPDPYRNNKNEIDINAISAGETFVLRNIYFHPQSHNVRTESLAEMEKLANALKKFPKLKIQVEGHICCVLDYPDAFDVDAQDNHLSVNRARYIYDYLIAKGIAKDRLKYAGFGRSQPIVEFEKTEAEANKNRRVEIRVLEK